MSYLTVNNAFVKHTTFIQEARPPGLHLPYTQVTENNNQISTNGDKTIQEVWSKYTFNTNNVTATAQSFNKTWAAQEEGPEPEKMEEEVKVEEEEEEEEEVPKEKEEETSPSHHARRPMNAFLIFCKKHRSIVRERFPNLENRGVTRILGEWWALLDANDKAPYVGLAKEYKDAFLSANPDFKWYKLPAPPLRTLNVRPTSSNKVQSPVSSPTHILTESEFTPGKLADESQLGSLMSLMNNNFTSTKKPKSNENNNNNIEKNEYDSSPKSPVNLIKTSLPPKPFKKRTFDKSPDNNTVANILQNDISEQGSNMTNQDLVDKVVEKSFTKGNEFDRRGVRKSGRQCKGKRYEKFMVEGRLLSNKRDTKLTSQLSSIETELDMKLEETKPEPETPNLDHTIKRLAERTNMKSVLENQKNEERVRSTSESHETNFNLNQRISNLPSLSYDVFHQRKKDSKRRKRARTDSESKNKGAKIVKNEEQPVGSKKRKNKQSITHLKEDNVGCDLLAVLAEVAANTEKINSE